MSILRYCLDRRVLAVLGLVAVATAFLAPRALGATRYRDLGVRLVEVRMVWQSSQ